MIDVNLTPWDYVQGIGSLAALASIELAGRKSERATMWAWRVVIMGHAVILCGGVMLGLEGLYILNVGMMLAGTRNIIRDKRRIRKARREQHVLASA